MVLPSAYMIGTARHKNAERLRSMVLFATGGNEGYLYSTNREEDESMSDTSKGDILSDYDDILTVKDIMKILGISRKKVYELLDSGKVRSFRPGRAFVIAKIHLIDYIINSEE